jgi:hypothetical protein
MRQIVNIVYTKYILNISCTAVLYNIHIYIHINCPVDDVKNSNVLTLNISRHSTSSVGGISPIRAVLV